MKPENGRACVYMRCVCGCVSVTCRGRFNQIETHRHAQNAHTRAHSHAEVSTQPPTDILSEILFDRHERSGEEKEKEEQGGSGNKNKHKNKNKRTKNILKKKKR